MRAAMLFSDARMPICDIFPRTRRRSIAGWHPVNTRVLRLGYIVTEAFGKPWRTQGRAHGVFQ
jgi:hypothetical protein